MSYITREYDYDDVFVVPDYDGPSTVNSRDSVNLSLDLGRGLVLGMPIIASPMKGIISPELIIKLSHFGGIGILHRFYSDKDEYRRICEQLAEESLYYGAAIGIGESDKLQIAVDNKAKIICVDVANGYIESLLDFCTDISYYLREKEILLMTGNIVTGSGVKLMEKAGVDLIRVGIGSGGLCTTRNRTGIGRPQISTVQECSSVATSSLIVSDGGIRHSDDIVKVLAAGADLVMIGSLLARTYESANNGVIYGGASARMNEEYYHGKAKSVEGKEKEVAKDISLDDLLFDPEHGLVPGIRSACTYLNTLNIGQISYNSKLVGRN